MNLKFSYSGLESEHQKLSYGHDPSSTELLQPCVCKQEDEKVAVWRFEPWVVVETWSCVSLG